ncbi:MAG TPA: metallophosphoesterase [Jatrophihabitans sp.]|nr:metallophosphoesterase [Jatrophihabitans sp.]
MKNWHRAALTAAAVGVLVASTAPSSTASPATNGGYTFAVIGDIPYGAAQIANFPNVVAQINADPAVEWVTHLGDIKDGSSVCSDAYFQMTKTDFDRFVDPLVYTVGDNEWTDCHRTNNGTFNPLERLAKIREVFFPRPGRTLGEDAAPVLSQAGQGIPENVRWERAGISFAAADIVGSNDGMAPWPELGFTTPTPEQTAEVQARTSATIQEFHNAFAAAKMHHDRAVALMIQADMFDPTVTDPAIANYDAFIPIVNAIASEARSFSGPVYLFNGDSHVFNADQPLAAGSKWLSFYGVAQPVPNLMRVTVDGSTGVNNYLRVTVHQHGPQVLSWERVPFATT